MSTINFSDVQDNNNTNERAPRKTIPSGYIGLVTIEEAEIKANSNNNEFISAKLVNPEGQYLKTQFYLTPKALVRLKEFVVNSDLPLVENEPTEALCARLIGKQIGVKVDGEKELAVIDGKELVVTRGVLGFRNFSYKATEASPYKEADVYVKDKTGALPVGAAGLDLPQKDDVNDLPF